MKKKTKKTIIIFFKHTKSNIFISIIYKKKVKFLISSGVLGLKGKEKREYISIERVIRKFFDTFLEFLLKFNKNNFKIKTFLFLDLSVNFFRIRRPLLVSFWYHNIVIDKIYLKNSLRHGGCKFKKKTIRVRKKKKKKRKRK